MFYYKVFNLESKEFLGIINSLNFRCFNESRKTILICKEDEAQYVYLNSVFYKIANSKQNSFKDFLSEIQLECIAKEEYLKIKEQEEKEISEQK